MLSTYAQSHRPSRGPDFLNRGVGDTHRLPVVRWIHPWGATRGTILCTSLISTHTSHTQSQPGSPPPRALQTLDLPAPHFSQLARKGGGVGSRGGPGRCGSGSLGFSCCLWPHCVTSSVIYPWQGPAPQMLPAPHLPTRKGNQLLRTHTHTPAAGQWLTSSRSGCSVSHPQLGSKQIVFTTDTQHTSTCNLETGQAGGEGCGAWEPWKPVSQERFQAGKRRGLEYGVGVRVPV